MSPNPFTILESETLEMMFVDQYSRDEDPQTNGLGFFTDSIHFGEDLLIYHDGIMDGTASSLLMLPYSQIIVCI